MSSFYKKITTILAELKSLIVDDKIIRDAELTAVTVFKALSERSDSAIVVFENSSQIDAYGGDLRLFLNLAADQREVMEFHEYEAGSGLYQPDNDTDRNAVLGRILDTENSFILLTTVAAFCGPVAPPQTFEKMAVEITPGQMISPEQLAEKLVEMQYDNEFQVNLPGEFARRGGILDVFSPLYKEPCRIEFFGDEVDSIRSFDQATQRSIAELQSLKIVPRAGKSDEQGRLLDYCPTAEVVLINEETLLQHMQRYFDHGLEQYEMVMAKIQNQQKILLSATDQTLPAEALASLYRSSMPELNSHVAMIHSQYVTSQLAQWTSTGCDVLVFCGTKGNRQRLTELVAENKEIKGSKIFYEDQSLQFGFFYKPSRTVILSENEIFGRSQTNRQKKSARQQALEAFLEAEPEISPGDYAVHAAHGICRYEGIEIQENGGLLKEVMALEFADERKLYVPLDSAHLVSRYIGGRKGIPKLSKIGTAGWKNACEKAASSANDLAADLLRLQAMRKHAKGHVFTPDNEWQRMFEEAFPYEETEDQLKSIEAVKKDMESPQPMDRLICGDVGFGKTEVALRAAFKAIMDGRQVALIVPTTVLAQQHFRTFSQRMADYPVDIRMLSRFVTKKEQNKTLEDMASGSCDLVIGTHRLLQKDIQFERLGLLIIDEEQRFGVEDKERLKRMRATVDILTMTATPIPRTLYFSLAGLRDFSTIMTPPVERKPVKTIIAQEDNDIIKQAIMRELERGGQVYVLHNRVQTIEKRAFEIQQLIPQAKVVFGHGQMKDSELESIMKNLINHKFDVLVSTTIIESGLDNPRANTMIIDRADRFGLAELYQLRGRVGRYHHQAYCYLLLPKHGLLMDTARQRLAAIRRYTHLGAGFKLAMRDLEIRGAGNLLGKEQSGHIAAVGFEMYCRLLKSSVEKLSHKNDGPSREIYLSLDFLPLGMSETQETACLPQSYIESEDVRLDIYKKAASIKEIGKLQQLEEEVRDRFGRFPQSVGFFFKYLDLKIRALNSGLHSLSSRDGRVFFEDEDGYRRLSGRIPQLHEGTVAEKLSEVVSLLSRVS